MARHEGTPRAPKSGQIQNRHGSVRATPFGGGGVRRAHTPRVSAAELALLQAKLPRNSSQIARGRIRRFESYMPSQAVQSPPSKKCESARNRAVSEHFGMRDPTGTARLRSAYRAEAQRPIIS
jgi:hypothetical protein